MRCRDKSLRYLQRLGYNVVRLPQEGITPLQVIGMQGDAVNYLGHISDTVLRQDANPPPVEQDLSAAEISGQATSAINIGLGISILGAIFSALGGNLDVNASYKSAKKIKFKFHDVLKDRVAPLKLDRYFRGAEFNRDNMVLEPYIEGSGKIFVITETIKANEFTVVAEDKRGGEAKIDVPAIKSAVEGKIEVSASSDQASTVSYKGGKHLTFGFQCFELAYSDGDLRLISSSPGYAYMGSPIDDEASDFEPTILVDSQLLEVRSEAPPT